MEQQKVAVVTGGARGIGRGICDEFACRGAAVCVIDTRENDYFTGDIADRETLEVFAGKVIAEYGAVDYLVNNACLSRGGLCDCSYDDFDYVLRTGVTAPFYLTRLFSDHFRTGASIVNISSTRQFMSQGNTESYTAAKGGIGALTHAMAVSLAGRVRVNAVSPGWIETTGAEHSGSDAHQHPSGRVGTIQDIVNAVMFLCDPANGFINGQNIVVDGGMTKLMIYHHDGGWTFDA
ncbi:MAG: SDR family oxidoreductase [Spirochaetales bacterium]|nr:SDR family oxidoreductase [Spirochaetales bacterium]